MPSPDPLPTVNRLDRSLTFFEMHDGKVKAKAENLRERRTSSEACGGKCEMGSSSSDISGGHGDKACYNRGVLYGTKSLTSNRMLPHCGYEGLSTLGLKQ